MADNYLGPGMWPNLPQPEEPLQDRRPIGRPLVIGHALPSVEPKHSGLPPIDNADNIPWFRRTTVDQALKQNPKFNEGDGEKTRSADSVGAKISAGKASEGSDLGKKKGVKAHEKSDPNVTDGSVKTKRQSNPQIRVVSVKEAPKENAADEIEKKREKEMIPHDQVDGELVKEKVKRKKEPMYRAYVKQIKQMETAVVEGNGEERKQDHEIKNSLKVDELDLPDDEAERQRVKNKFMKKPSLTKVGNTDDRVRDGKFKRFNETVMLSCTDVDLVACSDVEPGIEIGDSGKPDTKEPVKAELPQDVNCVGDTTGNAEVLKVEDIEKYDKYDKEAEGEASTEGSKEATTQEPVAPDKPGTPHGGVEKGIRCNNWIAPLDPRDTAPNTAVASKAHQGKMDDPGTSAVLKTKPPIADKTVVGPIQVPGDRSGMQLPPRGDHAIATRADHVISRAEYVASRANHVLSRAEHVASHAAQIPSRVNPATKEIPILTENKTKPKSGPNPDKKVLPAEEKEESTKAEVIFPTNVYSDLNDDDITPSRRNTPTNVIGGGDKSHLMLFTCVDGVQRLGPSWMETIAAAEQQQEKKGEEEKEKQTGKILKKELELDKEKEDEQQLKVDKAIKDIATEDRSIKGRFLSRLRGIGQGFVRLFRRKPKSEG